MVDVITIIATVASIVASVATLAYWLGKKFTEVEFRLNYNGRLTGVESRLTSLEDRVTKLEERLNRFEGMAGRLENAFIQFSDILITVFESKSILTSTEALSLRSVVRTLLPVPRTKYYTWEVYEKLKQLLDKDPNDYTMADIEQLNEIADLN